jgi:broad specificity phosphatase PhoE
LEEGRHRLARNLDFFHASLDKRNAELICQEWCRRKEGDYLHAGEPEQPFIERLTEFKEWLLRRPEKRIAVVAHWGAIYGLTGESYIYTYIHKTG